MIPAMRFNALLLAVCCVAVWPGTATQRSSPRELASFDVTEKSIDDLQKALRDRQITSRQLVELYLARIDAYDQRGPALNAIIALNPQATDQAVTLDAERAAGRVRGPLHGIPVLVKDNYETVEMPTTAGSIALARHHPKRDATLVRRLREAGAIILGKTTMHELAAGVTTVGSSFGVTRNPYDLDRTPGGSSGGTGAAIAASFAAAGMGSDTCGSIRIPAANNNLVGLRATQGHSSRSGIVPLSSSQDIGGPLARTVADLALLLDATAGADPADPQTMTAAARDAATAAATKSRDGYRGAMNPNALKGARIGIVRSLFGSAPEDQEVTRIVNTALEAIKKSGAELSDVVVPGLDELLRDSSLIGSDFKFDIMDYLASAPGAPVTSLGEILERGLYHSALESTFRMRNTPDRRDTEARRRARIKQTALRQVTGALLEERRLDAILYPTLKRRPARIGEPQGGTNCSLSAHSGLPALSLPAGFTADGVPIGLELLGPAFSEHRLIALGSAVEKTLDARRRPFSTPPLTGGRAPSPRGASVSVQGATIDLTYDETTSRLRYTVSLNAPQKTRPAAVWLHMGTPAKPGAARHQMLSARTPSTTTVTGDLLLAARDRAAVAEGTSFVRFYFADAESRTTQLPPLRQWR